MALERSICNEGFLQAEFANDEARAEIREALQNGSRTQVMLRNRRLTFVAPQVPAAERGALRARLARPAVAPGSRLRARLAEASDHFAQRLGKDYAAITLRDTRSRWGSCTAQGRLMYSWRLILAPPEVLDYVAAHEVAHLAQMNHSPAFWAEVERIYGDYSQPRAWLRREGSSLHRYRFGQ